MNRCVVLTRVASIPQKVKDIENYAPIKSQLVKCRKYAKENNLEIVKEVSYIGETDFLDLCNQMSENNAPNLLMVDSNKLARNMRDKFRYLSCLVLGTNIHITSCKPLI